MSKNNKNDKASNKSKNTKVEEEEKKSNTPSSIYSKDGKTFIVIDAKPNSKSNAIVGINFCNSLLI